MTKSRSRSLGPVALTVLLLGLGLTALLYSNREEPAAPVEAAGATPEQPLAPAGGEPDSLIEAATDSLTTGRTLAPAAGRTEGEDDIASAPEKSAALSATEVEVLIDDNPWLAEGPRSGELKWGGSGEDDPKYAIKFTGPTRGTVSLPAPPSGAEEFEEVSVEGLSLKADKLEIFEGPEGKAYRLRASMADGASLVWAAGALHRPPVEVAVGGGSEPTSRKAFPFDAREGLVESRSGLQLPLVLPRLVREESVWVGAPGLGWRSFPLAPGSETVEVLLTPAAGLRVLHDPPSAGKTLYVFTTAYPKGNTDSKAFKTGSPVTFGERPAAIHEVWIAARDDMDAPAVSHRPRIELVAGETIEVDLTAAYARTQLGGLRVHLRGNPETIKLVGRKLRPGIQRKGARGTGGAGERWERAGELTRVAHGTAKSNAPGHLVFEALGLEPVTHRVTVAPFGTSTTQLVVKGETRDVDIDLDEIGWVELVYPDDYEGSGALLTLTSQTPDPADAVFVSLPGRSAGRHPMAAGTYIAEAVTIVDSSDQVPLGSEPFIVRRGETVEVVLETKAPLQVHVEAREAATDELINLNLNFWAGLDLVDATSSDGLVRLTSFDGDDDSYRGVTWHLKQTDNPAKLIIPESPFWIFDDPLPFTPEHESTIVLRARTK